MNYVPRNIKNPAGYILAYLDGDGILLFVKMLQRKERSCKTGYNITYVHI